MAGVGSSLPYCASKAGLNNLTVTMARVLVPEVRVNAVAPGFIIGRWWKEGQGDDVHDAVAEAAAKNVPPSRRSVIQKTLQTRVWAPSKAATWPPARCSWSMVACSFRRSVSSL